MMLAFSFESITELLLPGTNDNTSLLHIVAYIRDIYDCVTEYNISSVLVQPNLDQLNDLMKNFRNTTATNIFLQMLVNGNMNTINQVITSLSQYFNHKINQLIEAAVESKYIFISTLNEYIFLDGASATTIFISPLGSTTQLPVSIFV